MRVAAYAAVSVFALATAKNARIQRLKRKSKQPIAHFWARRRLEEKTTNPQSDVYMRIITRQAGLNEVGQASTGPRTPTHCWSMWIQRFRPLFEVSWVYGACGHPGFSGDL